jgi:hypothetical protein
LNFERYSTADEVRPVAEGLITRLNGIAALEGGYRPVRFAGRIERDESTWVYVSDSIRVVDVAITADGAVTRDDGTVQVARQMSPMMSALQLSENHPILAEIYRILGSRQRASWVEFYKVYELLRQECGGDRALASRTDVAGKRIHALTKNCNHQSLTGDEARHAAMPGELPANQRITVDDGRAIVGELVAGLTRSLRDI